MKKKLLDILSSKVFCRQFKRTLFFLGIVYSFPFLILVSASLFGAKNIFVALAEGSFYFLLLPVGIIEILIPTPPIKWLNDICREYVISSLIVSNIIFIIAISGVYSLLKTSIKKIKQDQGELD